MGAFTPQLSQWNSCENTAIMQMYEEDEFNSLMYLWNESQCCHTITRLCNNVMTFPENM